MDWAHQQQHYDHHVHNVPTHVALQQRAEGPAEPLKRFHNHIKRQLIKRFASNAQRFIDFCCGRGGDLMKWREAQIQYVKGLDISGNEIEEARRRHAEQRGGRYSGPPLRADFQQLTTLGSEAYVDGPGCMYDAAACMFAIHYFFASEDSLRHFLSNVANNLRHGGYFIGTVPDGRRVVEALGGREEYDSEMLRLVKKWKGPDPGYFGAGYICNIKDTVTSSTEVSEGSLEFLVFDEAFFDIAADYKLYPVLDYQDPVLASNFDHEDILKPLKHFKPFFRDSHPSLEKASALFSAFVLQKADGPAHVSAPVANPCEHMELRPPRGMGRGRGGQGGGVRGHGRQHY